MTHRTALWAPVVLALFLTAALATPAKAFYSEARMNGQDIDRALHCLALNIYFEARSEPRMGMISVAHVVLNRARSPRFPDTVCAVVKDGGETHRHRCQFSWYCDGKSDRPRDDAAWETARSLARAVFWSAIPDPTGDATHYHAEYVDPPWAARLTRGPKIGQHIFYNDPRDGQVARR